MGVNGSGDELSRVTKVHPPWNNLRKKSPAARLPLLHLKRSSGYIKTLTWVARSRKKHAACRHYPLRIWASACDSAPPTASLSQIDGEFLSVCAENISRFCVAQNTYAAERGRNEGARGGCCPSGNENAGGPGKFLTKQAEMVRRRNFIFPPRWRRRGKCFVKKRACAFLTAWWSRWRVAANKCMRRCCPTRKEKKREIPAPRWLFCVPRNITHSRCAP